MYCQPCISVSCSVLRMCDIQILQNSSLCAFRAIFWPSPSSTGGGVEIGRRNAMFGVIYSKGSDEGNIANCMLVYRI